MKIDKKKKDQVRDFCSLISSKTRIIEYSLMRDKQNKVFCFLVNKAQ